MPLSQSQLGQQLNIRNVMLVSVTENSESVGARETHSSLLNNPISTTPDCSPVFSTNEEVVVLKADLKGIKTQERGARAIIDSGSPITIAGLDWFRSYFNSMSKAIRSRLEVEAKTTFQFGGGERRKSLGIITAPFYILDDESQAHMVMIKIGLVKAPKLRCHPIFALNS